MARPKWRIMKAICKSICNGSTYYAACKAASTNETTLWRWRQELKNKRGRTFGEFLQELWDRRVNAVEDAHYIAALKGSTRAQENFLNNRARHRWQKDPDTVIKIGDDHSKHVTQIFQSAPQRIVFDDGEGDRKNLAEDVPEDCQVTPADAIEGEGQTECLENRLP